MSDKKVWLISGCSSGLGNAIAEKALQNGSLVAATARNTDVLTGLNVKYGESVITLTLDVNDKEQMQAVISRVIEQFGRIDVLVNNAGYGLAGALEEYEEDEMLSVFNTNFWSAINLTRKVLPIMRSQRSGHIINISAGAAIMNEKGFSIYAASKAALEMTGEALCWELKPLGINVTNVVPGPFRTDFIKRSLKKAKNRISDYDNTSGKFIEFLEKTDGKQPGDPFKAAKAILHITEVENPPLYLYLGKYAYKAANRKIEKIKEYLDDFEDIGLDTNFD